LVKHKSYDDDNNNGDDDDDDDDDNNEIGLRLTHMKVKVKVKFSQCFNRAPRYGGVLGVWRYSFTHSLTSALDEGE
jgi:hypothetical protein